MKKEIPKVRFALREKNRTIKRELKSKNKPPGTLQLVCNITWNQAHKISIIKESKFLKTPLTWDKNASGKYKGSFSLGMAGLGIPAVVRNKLINIERSFGKYKINSKGELIQYDSIKLQTGIYVLPASWLKDEQKVTQPYEWANKEMEKIVHIVKNTFNELKDNKDFSKELFHKEIKSRMKNGMPITIVVSGPDSQSESKVMYSIREALAADRGINLPDDNNKKNVPEDLIDFIPYYQMNRIDTKVLAKATIGRQNQFRKKLERYKIATGKKLTITGSDINDIADFIKWRIYDNEENNVRNSPKIKSANQKVKTKANAVGVGTLNKTRKDIINIYNRAIDNFGCKLQFSTSHVVLKEESYDRESADIFLTMDQLKQILGLKIEKGSRLDKHRTLFCLGCLSGGYRVSDLIKLPFPKLNRFDDGQEYYTFEVVSTKTAAKTMAPIPDTLNYLIESYDFNATIKKHELRDDIKTLGKLCGWTNKVEYNEELADGSSRTINKEFYKLLMTKTCRKTYCSLLYNFWGLSIRECMEFSGHKSENEFRKYLKIDRLAQAQKLVDKFNVKPIYNSF